MAASSLGIRFAAEPVRSIVGSAVGVGYTGIGTALGNPIRQFFVQNFTDGTFMFSFDGVNDHFPLPPNSFFLDDVCSNTSVSQGWFLAEGTRLYVRYLSASTMGSVYFSVFYAAM